MRIELTLSAWKAEVLPLNYTCGQHVLLTRALILYHTSFACASVFPEFNSAFLLCGLRRISLSMLLVMKKAITAEKTSLSGCAA